MWCTVAFLKKHGDVMKRIAVARYPLIRSETGPLEPSGQRQRLLLKRVADGILWHPSQHNGWRKQWDSIWERACLLWPTSQCVCNLYIFCGALAEGQIVEGWKIPARKNHTFSCYFRADRVTLRTKAKDSRVAK